MVLYKCLTCLKEFDRKSSFITHTENKKKPCKTIKIEQYSKNVEIIQNYPILSKDYPKLSNFIQEEILNDNPNKCNFCFKNFSNIYNLKKHQNSRCKVKKLDNEKKDEIFNKLLENEEKMNKILNNYEELQKDNNKLKQHIKDLENKYNNDIKKIVNKNTNNNTINNTNNNITNNLIIPNDKLVNFGKEDLTKIEYEDIIKSCTGPSVTGYHVIIELIKLIHFNDKFPENQNVYMTDRNREKYMYYKNKWLLGDNNIFKEIMTQPQELIGNYEDEIEEDIENKKVTAKKINDILDKYYDCKAGFNEIVEPKVKDLIYNNKEDVKNNFLKIQNQNESKMIKE